MWIFDDIVRGAARGGREMGGVLAPLGGIIGAARGAFTNYDNPPLSSRQVVDLAERSLPRSSGGGLRVVGGSSVVNRGGGAAPGVAPIPSLRFAGIGAPQGRISFPAIPQYSTQPAALTARELAMLDALQINADEDLALARANREKALQQLDTEFVQNTGRLSRMFQDQRENAGRRLMTSMSGFSPGTAGRLVRRLRDDQAGQAAELRDVRTRGMAQLEQMVNAAEVARNRTAADVARQRAALSGDYQRLLPGVRY